MKRQTPFVLLTLVLAIACNGGGGGGSNSSYDPETSHSPEVPIYASGPSNWISDAFVINPNEVTVANGASITAKKGAAMGQFQNGSIIVTGGTNSSGTVTKSAQMISSSNVVTSVDDLEEEVTGASNVMIVPGHVGMTNEFYVVGGTRIDGKSSNKVQKYSNNGTKTVQTELFFGTSKGEMAHDMTLVSIIGGRWEAYEYNSITPDGINISYFGSDGYWTAAPNDDLERTPVYEMTDHKLANMNGGTVSVGGKYSGRDVYLVDFSNQVFVKSGNLDVAVQAGHDAFGEANGSIVTVIGGAVIGANCTTASQKYDFNTGSQETTHMNIGRCGHFSVELADGDIIVVGGRRAYNENSERTSSIERYDAATKTWKVVGMLGQARSGHKVFARGVNQLVVVGGSDANGNPIAQTEIITY